MRRSVRAFSGNLPGGVGEPKGLAGQLAVPREVEGDQPELVRERLHLWQPCVARKRCPVQEDDGRGVGRAGQVER